MEQGYCRSSVRSALPRETRVKLAPAELSSVRTLYLTLYHAGRTISNMHSLAKSHGIQSSESYEPMHRAG